MRHLTALNNARWQGQNFVLIGGLILSAVFAAGILVGGEGFGPASPARVDQKADQQVDFKRHVKPIFEVRCIKCHGADNRRQSCASIQKLQSSEAASPAG